MVNYNIIYVTDTKNTKYEISINNDDNIKELKRIIVNDLFENKKATDELYLYVKKEKKIESYEIYQKLTLNERYKITKNVLEDFFDNIYSKKENIKYDKEIYSYIDLLNINFNWGEPNIISLPITNNFETTYFKTNPFNFITIDRKINDNFSLMNKSNNKLIFEENIYSNFERD